MDQYDKKQISRIQVKLETIRKSLGEHKLDDTGMRWFTDKRKQHLETLLGDVNELVEMGIQSKSLIWLQSIFKGLLHYWGQPDALEKSKVPNEPTQINKHLDMVIMQLQFIISRKEYLFEAYSIKTKTQILKDYGDMQNFIRSLKTHVINRSGDKELKDFYDLYCTIFTLPEEQESFEGFETVLGMNGKEDVAHKFGRYEETILTLKEPKTDILVAAVSFSIAQMPDEAVNRFGIYATNHIMYIMVRANYRKVGLGQYLLKLTKDYSERYIGNGNICYFCEQNSPKLMTINEYLQDNMNAGIDQCDRLMWWSKRGFSPLDFRYVQPPLEPGSAPCTGLTLNTNFQSPVPSQIIIEHLSRFIEISVLKGNNPNNDKYFMAMVNDLQGRPVIPIMKEDFVSLKQGISKIIFSNDLRISKDTSFGKLMNE